MPPRKQPIVRVTGLIIAGLSFVSLGVTAVDFLVHVLPVWHPYWSNYVPAYSSVYQGLSHELVNRLPWLLFSWISIAGLAVGIKVIGMWPTRANLVRG